MNCDVCESTIKVDEKKPKLLILGHRGMLGNMCLLYFTREHYSVITTTHRWPSKAFKTFVSKANVDFIINAIGMIPQKKPDNKLYNEINFKLPMWLDKQGIRVIHPDTDEPDTTPYGLSKRLARENMIHNTRIIKSSIMGFEQETKCSFLEWFLNSDGSINGYTNQRWNGNTTLEWAKWAEKIIKNWEYYKNVTTIANPDCRSKYDILLTLKGLFQKDIEIIPTKAPEEKNNCLTGEYITNDLLNQLIEMRYFYGR